MTRGRAMAIAESFAPAHVTAIFSPVLEAQDPRSRGSVGAGLVLEAGVSARAEWRPSRRTAVQIHSDVSIPLPISEEVARRSLAYRPGRLDIWLRHELPIGQGFGMSAAGALATALAVASVCGVPRRKAVETAHLADLFGGGGLGGVAAILGGGMEIRRQPGIPPWGKVAHFPASGSLFLVVAGAAIPSPHLLRSPRFLARVQRAAGLALHRLRRRPSVDRLLAEAEAFTDALRLGPADLLRRIHALRSDEIRVAQAMFGRSLFVRALTHRARVELLGKLERIGFPAVEVPIGGRGARLISGPGG